MADFKFNCKSCNQRLEAPQEMAGQSIECPACNSSIIIPFSPQPVSQDNPKSSQPQTQVPVPPQLVPQQTSKSQVNQIYQGDPATEKQIAYIIDLGGTVPAGLTKYQASEQIDELRKTAPPSEKQRDILNKLGVSVPTGVTYTQASELITKVDGDQPPTAYQIKNIKMLGGQIPDTKREADNLLATLRSTAPATSQQKKRAQKLGIDLPPTSTFADTKDLLHDPEKDADKEDGKPPTKAQINKIVKLGGDPAKVINNWRAEEYIEELEEQEVRFMDRVDGVLWDCYNDSNLGMMPVKKPSKAKMAEALRYGDSQGWGDGWEKGSLLKAGESEYDFIAVAIYAIAPELLKKDRDIPRLDRQGPGKSGVKGKGCLAVLLLLLISGIVLLGGLLRLIS